MTRVLLFTGKGGVGKTTTSAATALHLADEGRRVVVTSADPAHSLADAFDRELGSEPRPVVANCDAQQIDAHARFQSGWGEVRDWLTSVLEWMGVGGVEAEELTMLPGLEELVALAELESLYSSGRYDVVVVDCAPTAETLRLLSLPDVASWYLRRIHPNARRLNRMVSPVLQRLTSLPTANDEVFVAGERFAKRLDAVHRILADPGTTTARLVMNPERMVVAESRRTFASLSLFGYAVDAIVVNKTLPATVTDHWFDRWRVDQQATIGAIEADFAPTPVRTADLSDHEIQGVEALRSLGKDLWDGVDAAARLVDRRPWRVESAGADMVLTVELPNARASEVGVDRVGDELIVTLGPHRRTLALPDVLARRGLGATRFDDGELVVTFVGPAGMGDTVGADGS
jgi:arsenite/tail-anchored protein-transporting ATPase